MYFLLANIQDLNNRENKQDESGAAIKVEKEEEKDENKAGELESKIFYLNSDRLQFCS